MGVLKCACNRGHAKGTNQHMTQSKPGSRLLELCNLGHLLKLCEPRFPHLKNGNNKRYLLWGLSLCMKIQHNAQHRAAAVQVTPLIVRIITAVVTNIIIICVLLNCLVFIDHLQKQGHHQVTSEWPLLADLLVKLGWQYFPSGHEALWRHLVVLQRYSALQVPGYRSPESLELETLEGDGVGLNPTLQVRKVRLKEVKQFPKVTQTGSRALSTLPYPKHLPESFPLTEVINKWMSRNNTNDRNSNK